MISLDNLTVSYGGWTLFDNISFLINPKDRIGLVGRNGAGKTTLLRIITGEQQPTSGSVTLNGDCTIGYLPQTMRVADTTTLAEETAKAFEEVLRLEAEIEHLTHEIAERTDYESDGYAQLLHRLNDAQDHYHILGGETRDADIEKTLLGLGFKRGDFGRPTSEFSGGWRMRIELAKLLLRRPSIFLLDEPTNHLDIESIQWLEDYLKNYSGAVLLISHDRAFLDNVTNRTVELSLGKATDYKVSYSKYVVLRAERRAQQMAAYENQQRMIEKTEEFIEKFRYKPTKSNQVQSRIKQLERLERLEVEEEDLATLNIKFPPAPRSGQIVAEINEAGMSFGAKHVFSGANFIIGKGDKIALVGRNGEGKTTLARMLVGQLTPTEGSVRLGANVNIGYYAQNQDDLMDGEFTVYDTLDRVAVGDIRTRLRDILGAFLFRGEDIDKKGQGAFGRRAGTSGHGPHDARTAQPAGTGRADQPHGHAFEGHPQECHHEVRRHGRRRVARPRIPRRHGAEGLRVPRRRGEGVPRRVSTISSKSGSWSRSRRSNAGTPRRNPPCRQLRNPRPPFPANSLTSSARSRRNSCASCAGRSRESRRNLPRSKNRSPPTMRNSLWRPPTTKPTTRPTTT